MAGRTWRGRPKLNRQIALGKRTSTVPATIARGRRENAISLLSHVACSARRVKNAATGLVPMMLLFRFFRKIRLVRL
jgi:hypothetical protein